MTLFYFLMITEAVWTVIARVCVSHKFIVAIMETFSSIECFVRSAEVASFAETGNAPLAKDVPPFQPCVLMLYTIRYMLEEVITTCRVLLATRLEWGRCDHLQRQQEESPHKLPLSR